MKHPSNRELFDYWNEQRGDRLAPERADIEPGAIRKMLGDTFVLEAGINDSHLFRIAGTRLCALFGRELKGESFVRLWQRSGGQAAIRELIAVIMEEKVGVIASVTGATSDDSLRSVDFEMMILPLAYQSRADGRVMGTLLPMSAPYWLGAKAIGPLSLGMFRHIGAAMDAPAPRIRAAEGRIRRGLTVYDGGRAD